MIRPLAALLVLAALGSSATAQVYAPYFPSPAFNTFGTGYPLDGFATYFPAVNYGSVDFGAVNFGAVNFGAVDFGTTNFLPVAGYGYDVPYGGDLAYAASGMAPYGLAGATYNVGTMAASSASEAGAMIGRRSLENVLANDPNAVGGSGARYNLRTARSRSTSQGPRLIDMTARDGRVLWPASAPVGGDLGEKRTAADAAVRKAITGFRSSGRASVEDLGAALRNLAGYANPAIDQLRRDDPGAVFTFRDFVVDLDRALRRLAGKTPIDAPEIEPVQAR